MCPPVKSSLNLSLWVLSDARSEDQICQCVRKGDRPDDESIPEDTPQDILSLMKQCWNQDPLLRPTFKG